MEMDISVVIPTLNREEVLCQTIDSLLKEKENVKGRLSIEIIVVDQTKKHQDDTENYLQKVVGERYIRLLRSSTPSLTRARNLGISECRGRIIIFVDDDVLVQPGFYDAYMDTYNRYDNVMSVVGRVCLANKSKDNILLQNQTGLKSFIRKILMFLINRKKNFIISSLGFILYDMNIDTGQCTLTDGGMGCNMSFRKETFGKIGLYDTHYVGNAMREETDMFARLKKQGGKVMYQPKAYLLHMMNNTGGCRSIKTLAYWENYFYNQCYFYVKNFGFHFTWISSLLIFDIIKCTQRKIPVMRVLRESYKKACQEVHDDDKNKVMS